MNFNVVKHDTAYIITCDGDNTLTNNIEKVLDDIITNHNFDTTKHSLIYQDSQKNIDVVILDKDKFVSGFLPLAKNDVNLSLIVHNKLINIIKDKVDKNDVITERFYIEHLYKYNLISTIGKNGDNWGFYITPLGYDFVKVYT